MKMYQSTLNPNRIILNRKTRLNIPVNFVVMLTGQVNYTTFIMSDGSQRVVAHTLKYFEPFYKPTAFRELTGVV